MNEELKKKFAEANEQAKEINNQTQDIIDDITAKCKAIRGIQVDTKGIVEARINAERIAANPQVVIDSMKDRCAAMTKSKA